jgi:dihydrolipoamide dehydrogenase
MGIKVRTGHFQFRTLAKSHIMGEIEGMIKIISDESSDRILGVHMIGPHATDLIAEASLGFTLDVAAWEIGAATHPHPTLSEALGEAAMAVDGRSINI